MKILQVIDGLNIGGAERVFVDMCNLLHENNENVSALLLLKKEGDLAKELNVPTIELNRSNKWNLITLYKCGQIIKKYDIIHCHLRYVYKYIMLVHFLVGGKRKIIFQDHYGSIDVDVSVPKLFSSILKPSYYIGVSQSLTDWALRHVKVKEQRIFLLQNIIRKFKATEEFYKTSDLLLVSNIKPIKNNAFAVALAKELELKLLLVGRNQEDTYYSELQKSIDNDLVKIDGTLSNAQSVMGKARIGLHTSKSETGPLVLIEYLAQGLPFVAYKTGEVAQMLVTSFPEFFIDNFEIDQWKAKIEYLLNNGPDSSKMSKIFEEKFGEKQYYTKLKEIYLCVIKE